MRWTFRSLPHNFNRDAGFGVPRAQSERVSRAILRSVARLKPQERLLTQPPRSVTENVLPLLSRVSIAKLAASKSRKGMQNSG